MKSSVGSLSFDQLDNLAHNETKKVLNTVKSNTNWKKTEDHKTVNGVKLNC